MSRLDLAGVPGAPAAFESVRPLGVGLMYNPAVPGFLEDHLDAIDFLEITSDMFWTDRGPGSAQRFEDLESWTRVLDGIAADRPVVAHNVGLSIGSANRFDVEYLGQIKRWQERYRFPWHSDHLSFSQILDARGRDRAAGMALPLPFDEQVLQLVAGRVARVREAIPVPFLLENGVSYLEIPEQEMTEPAFLNRLTKESGCGLLLDLHNLHTNSRNYGADPLAFLEELDFDPVVEIHVAGGNEFAGMYTDAHSGPCPEPVWELLDYVLPRTRNLCGITFEFHDSYYGQLGPEGLRAQLDRARRAWTSERRP